MSDHEPQFTLTPECIGPTTEPPGATETEYCEGVIRLEKCCCKKQTHTIVQAIGPQSEASLQSFIQVTANAWEAAGYCIEAHSIVDTGAGWMFGLTVSWT